MTKFIYTIGLIAALLCSCNAQSQRKFSNFKFENQEYSYAFQLPENYDPDKTYPVLVGPSDVKDNDDQSFYWRGTKNTEGWILIDYPIYNATGRLDEIKAFLKHITSTFNVEDDKFHTVCFSANSASIFDLVMAMPDHFTGITGMAGNPGTRDIEKLSKLKGVKIQFIVGDRDSYWMRAAKDRHELLISAGVESQIEIIKNGPHVLQDLIGKGFLERAHRLR